MSELRWLHFTDLHIRHENDPRWQSAREPLLKDLAKLTEKHGPWDLVLCTGDLVFKGEAEEYTWLDRELGKIWEAVGNPSTKLLAVPGNHDLARPTSNRDRSFAKSLRTDAEMRDDLWNGEDLATVSGWFNAYSAWWKRCKEQGWAPETVEGLLPGDFVWTFEKDDLRIGFAGLNSAFLQASDDVHDGDLRVDLRQLHEACGGDFFAWRRRHDLAFLLTHHPPSWFATDDEMHTSQGAFFTGEHFAAHFCGHLHEARDENLGLGSAPPRRVWQSTSLFGEDTWKKCINGGSEVITDRRYGYTAGHVKFDSSGQVTDTRWPRLAVKLQSGGTRLASDPTFDLEEDFVATRPQVLSQSCRAAAVLTPTSSPNPAGEVTEPSEGWLETAQRSVFWQALAQGQTEVPSPLQRLVSELITLAWEAWEAASKTLSDHPWLDRRLPIRVLDRIAALSKPADASPEDAALLLGAPFLHEAVLAAGAAWMMEAEPLDLASRSVSNEPRNTLEQVHRSREDLVRRAQGITDPSSRAAVCFWMVEQALTKSTRLWNENDTGKPIQHLFGKLSEQLQKGPTSHCLLLKEWLRVARTVGIDPDALDAEGGVGRDAQEVTFAASKLHVPAVAYLLCVAGWAALDSRRVDDVAVDHLGREANFCGTQIRDALGSAEWRREENRRHVLAHTCDHPVVDFVLVDLVKRADLALTSVRTRLADTANGTFALLRELPERFAANGVKAAKREGRSVYTTPHVRFQLAHQRIRELLIGEQLYGDPQLAIRELYQNALDACRYRDARTEHYERRTGTYEGKIRLRQGTDDEGRLYIECDDNGVGMTKTIVERVFAVAGRRFHDMPDFLEERANWERAGIKFYPNSQFGIGVLSYFMLADEVTVWTKRYEADGGFGKPLIVHISSASGLFRLEEPDAKGLPEALQQGGTRVRLYLRSPRVLNTAGNEQPVSCLGTLRKLLWVAEFDTAAEEEGATEQWKPGVLRHPEGEPVCESEHPDVWWIAHGRGEPQGRLLCDGIRTETRAYYPRKTPGFAGEAAEV